MSQFDSWCVGFTQKFRFLKPVSVQRSDVMWMLRELLFVVIILQVSMTTKTYWSTPDQQENTVSETTRGSQTAEASDSLPLNVTMHLFQFPKGHEIDFCRSGSGRMTWGLFKPCPNFWTYSDLFRPPLSGSSSFDTCLFVQCPWDQCKMTCRSAASSIQTLFCGFTLHSLTTQSVLLGFMSITVSRLTATVSVNEQCERDLQTERCCSTLHTRWDG